jgi:hypothetical protein
VTPESLHEQLLRAFACVAAAHSATYVSGPITTGRRFLHWYAKSGHSIGQNTAEYRKTVLQEVISPNERDLAQLARQVRQSTTDVVIEPTPLMIPGWSQSEFHQFWVDLIARFCRRMIVIDGWQYSAGCAIEFRQGVQMGIPVQDPRGREVTLSEGQALILRAAHEIGSVNDVHEDGPLRALGHRLQRAADL